jgi:CO/xanthine dehydrogenase FAD-binding subunit
VDLNTIGEVLRPSALEEIASWRLGNAWLGGGTWLFSEPQPALDTLIDILGFDWPALAVSQNGLEIAASCPIIELDRFDPPAEWAAGALLSQCCRSLLASFKIMNTATIGGNICMSLPAGALIALTVALESTYRLLSRSGEARVVEAADFVVGDHCNILAPGELLRSVTIPARALVKRCALRRACLTHLGRSAALIIGTQSPGTQDLLLTITAATPRPIQIAFTSMPDAHTLGREIDGHIPPNGYFDDVNGTPAYKRHLTYHFADQIRLELSACGAYA